MNITKISASVRFSKAIQPGCYKTIELSAEADVAPRENWHEAQSQLYTDLGDQLRVLWFTRSDQAAPTEQRNEHEDTSGTAPEHFCSVHNVEFRRHEKNGNVWYSHKNGNSWCNEGSR